MHINIPILGSYLLFVTRDAHFSRKWLSHNVGVTLCVCYRLISWSVSLIFSLDINSYETVLNIYIVGSYFHISECGFCCESSAKICFYITFVPLSIFGSYAYFFYTYRPMLYPSLLQCPTSEDSVYQNRQPHFCYSWRVFLRSICEFYTKLNIARNQLSFHSVWQGMYCVSEIFSKYHGFLRFNVALLDEVAFR